MIGKKRLPPPGTTRSVLEEEGPIGGNQGTLLALKRGHYMKKSLEHLEEKSPKWYTRTHPEVRGPPIVFAHKKKVFKKYQKYPLQTTSVR